MDYDGLPLFAPNSAPAPAATPGILVPSSARAGAGRPTWMAPSVDVADGTHGLRLPIPGPPPAIAPPPAPVLAAGTWIATHRPPLPPRGFSSGFRAPRTRARRRIAPRTRLGSPHASRDPARSGHRSPHRGRCSTGGRRSTPNGGRRRRACAKRRTRSPMRTRRLSNSSRGERRAGC